MFHYCFDGTLFSLAFTLISVDPVRGRAGIQFLLCLRIFPLLPSGAGGIPPLAGSARPRPARRGQYLPGGLFASANGDPNPVMSRRRLPAARGRRLTPLRRRAAIHPPPLHITPRLYAAITPAAITITPRLYAAIHLRPSSHAPLSERDCGS